MDMNKVKIFFVLFTLSLSTSVFSQEIDERLVKNKGELAQSAFKYNLNAYNYLVFELDYGYQVVAKKGLSKEDSEYTNGKILDPKNGKIYKCYITLETKDKLKVRGYIGISLFGRTQYWYRVKN